MTTPSSQTSLGANRVRASFNPSEQSVVDRFKETTAMLIDNLEEMRGPNVTGETLRLIALAQTGYEEACMWAVKAATAEEA